jgi:hypothetical protein
VLPEGTENACWSVIDEPLQLICMIQFEFTPIDDGLWMPYSTWTSPSTVLGVKLNVSAEIVSPIQLTLSEVVAQVGWRLATAPLAAA